MKVEDVKAPETNYQYESEEDFDGAFEDEFEEKEMITEEVLESGDKNNDESNFKYYTLNQDQAFISQKLQDFYDLLALQSKHPEFKDDVALQLKDYTKDSLNIYKNEDVVSINNIKLMSQSIRLDENTIKIQIQFDVKSNFKKTTDSIYAYITKKETVIDGESFISSKVIFSKD